MNPTIDKHQLSDGTPYFCCECVESLRAERDRLKVEVEELKQINALNGESIRLGRIDNQGAFRRGQEKMREQAAGHVSDNPSKTIARIRSLPIEDEAKS